MFSVGERIGGPTMSGLSGDEWRESNLILYHLAHTTRLAVGKYYTANGVPSYNSIFIRRVLRDVFRDIPGAVIEHVNPNQISGLAYDVVLPRDQFALLRLSAGPVNLSA